MDVAEEKIDNGEVVEIVPAVKELVLSDTDEDDDDDLWTDIDTTSSSSNESFERPSIYKSYTFICTGELPEDEQCNEILLPRLVKVSTLPKAEKTKVKKDDEMDYDSDTTELSSSDEGVEYRRVKGYPAMIRLIPALKAMNAIRKLRTWDTEHCMGAIREAGGTMSIKSCAQGSCPRPDKQSKFRIDGPFLRCSTNHFTTSSYGVDTSVDAIDEMEKRQKNHGNIRKSKKFPCRHVTKPRPCSFCRFWSFIPYTESEMYYADYLKDVTLRGHPPPGSSEPPTAAELALWSSMPIEIGPPVVAKPDLKVKEGSSGGKEVGSRLSRRPLLTADSTTRQTTRGSGSASLPRLVDPTTREKPLEKNSIGGPPRQSLPIRWNVKQMGPKIEPLVLPPVPALYENVPSRYMPPPIDLRMKLRSPEVLWSTTPPSRQTKQKLKPQLRPPLTIPALRRSPKKKKTLRSAKPLPAPRSVRTPRTPKVPRTPRTPRRKKPATPRNPKKSKASTPRNARTTVKGTDVPASNVKDIQLLSQPLENSLNSEQPIENQNLVETPHPPADPQIRQSGILQNPALAAARLHARTPLAEFLRKQEAESMESSGLSTDCLPCLKLLPEYPPKSMTADAAQNSRNVVSAPGTVQPLSPVAQSIIQAAFMAARIKLQRQSTRGRKTEELMRMKPSIMTMNRHYLESRARPLGRNQSPERLVLPKITPRGHDAARAFPTKLVPAASENVQEDPRMYYMFDSKPRSAPIGQSPMRSRTAGNKPFGSAKELLHDPVLDGPALVQLAKLKKAAKKGTSFIR